MLDQTVASYLQLFSLPLEMMGFLLAAIEIFASKRASTLSSIVIRQSGTMGSMVGFFKDEMIAGWKNVDKRYVVILGCGFVFLFGMAYFGFLFGHASVPFGMPTTLFMLVVIVSGTGIMIGLILLTYQIIRLSFLIAARVSDSKVLGTLGLMLASSGILLESYQYLTQAVLDPVQLVPFEDVVFMKADMSSAAILIGVIYFYGLMFVAIAALFLTRTNTPGKNK